MKRVWIIISLLLSSLVVTHCSNGTGSFVDGTSPTELAIGVLSGIASVSDTTGTMAYQKPALFEFHMIPKAWAISVCPSVWDANSATNCSGNVMTLTYSDCAPTASSISTWKGAQYLTFSGQTCGTPQTAWASGSVVRTFDPKTYRSTGTGVKIWMNTAVTSGYQSSVSGGTTINFVGAQARTATISGIEYFATKTIGDQTQTVWDQTVSTTSPLVIAGTGATRTLSSGTTLVQNNRLLFSASVMVQTALVFSDTTCCFPTSGVLATSFTGTQSGSETLTFSSSCGNATYVDSTGKSSTLALTHCL